MKAGEVPKGSWIKLASGERATKIGQSGNKVNVILGTGQRLVITVGAEVEVC